MKRTPLLLEIDERLRRIERLAAQGDEEARLALKREQRRVGGETHPFGKDIDEYHDLHGLVERGHKAKLEASREPWRHSAEQRDKYHRLSDFLDAATQERARKANTLAWRAHELNHPAGQYLDPRRFSNAHHFLRSLAEVSAHPLHGRPPYPSSGPGSSQARLDFEHEGGADHMRRSLQAHGLRYRDENDRWALTPNGSLVVDLKSVSRFLASHQPRSKQR